MTMNNEQKHICRHCGKEDDGASIFFEVDGRYVCEDCADEHYVWCDHCETYHHPDTVREVYVYFGTARNPVTENWCERCVYDDAATCDDCGCLINADCLTDCRRSGCVCPDCLHDEYTYCDECGQWVRNDRYDDDAEMCVWCVSENSIITGYHGADSANPKFRADDDAPEENRFFGLEIEIDRRFGDYKIECECAKALHELLDERAVFERDGSLDNGFEIVTRPHTLAAFKRDFPLDEMLSICRTFGYLAHNMGTCGLHLHISREYFGKTETAQERAIGKCIAFYDRFFEDMVRASRRTLSAAERWSNRVPAYDMKDARKKAKAGNWDSSRYSAVNTQNRHTVEFRLMRGTLNADTFRACFDLLVAIARNARRLSWENATTNPAEMLKGIAPATRDYLARRDAFVEYLDKITTARDGEFCEEVSK